LVPQKEDRETMRGKGKIAVRIRAAPVLQRHYGKRIKRKEKKGKNPKKTTQENERIPSGGDPCNLKQKRNYKKPV